MRYAAKLRELILAKELLIAPGAYDAITASIIQKAGFSAVYVTGSGVSLSLLAQPDMNTVSYVELKEKVDNMCSVLDIPLIVDIDTGFGGPLNLIRLVRDFERMGGVAGVQIEDQMMPKRCGHEMGRRLVSCEEMCQRIRTIKENRNQENGIVIIARTDACTTHGIDEALKRGNTYLRNGADVIFIESPESLDEVKRIGREVKGALLFNNVEGGRSPFISKDVLEQIGFNMSIYPNTLSRIMIKSGQKVLKELKDKGSTEKLWDEMLDHRELFKLFNHDEWVELEKKYTV